MYTSQTFVYLSFSSEDDPFLLYATLHSGNHCWFVSRDLMRDHKASLPDGATRRLFFKWQRGHQLVVDGYVTRGRRVRFLVRKRREVFEFRELKKRTISFICVCVCMCVQGIPSYDTIVQNSADSWHLPYDDTHDRSTYEVPQRWLCLTKNH